MRRRPYGHRKAESMMCDADRMGTEKSKALDRKVVGSRSDSMEDPHVNPLAAHPVLKVSLFSAASHDFL
ncbi:hypothetical protein AVEN_196345-1 [Araneus ventricosus]|uniref:Uncharacterized protein n=1 Tax=Araneus ventricosus TaxID=182803 RepID=A0A4Y2AU01_ARAVE|nr:hypothetical protein AVEN_196345-1 [Araneus ventricosus]